MSWQIQEAKQRFSELVRTTLAEGPQTVTRHGEPVVVVVPAAEYRKGGEPDDFAEFLLSGPSFEDLDLTRDPSPMRDIDLSD